MPTTARTDLAHLAELGLLATYKSGKQVHYVLSPDAAERLNAPRDAEP